MLQRISLFKIQNLFCPKSHLIFVFERGEKQSIKILLYFENPSMKSHSVSRYFDWILHVWNCNILVYVYFPVSYIL